MSDLKIRRRKTRVVTIGRIAIGGSNPIAIQSMTKAKTSDTDKTIDQAVRLQHAGCEIIRVAVKDTDDAKAIARIKPFISMPVVADIHFNWLLAIEAIERGADKVRLNPGNIFRKTQIEKIVSAAQQAHIPIRVGLNSGSVGNSQDQCALMVRKCKAYLSVMEKMKFYNTVISLKASDIRETVSVYRAMSGLCDYPFHLGVTATGLPFQGVVKTSIAIGTLLLDGIGDTIRVSLTDIPEEEVKSARAILESLKLRNFGVQVISCPTCGRCEVDMISVTKQFEKRLQTLNKNLRDGGHSPLSVAIMGCVVNGPGEASHADIGIAFGRKEGLLFKKGKPFKKVPVDRSVDVLCEEISKLK